MKKKNFVKVLFYFALCMLLLCFFSANSYGESRDDAQFLPQVYSVSIDYNKTIEEMVLAGNYDVSTNKINSKNFSIQGEGRVNIKLELIPFDKNIIPEYAPFYGALVYLGKKGMRPASIEELLSFGATYPEIQRQFPIVCLGAGWDWWESSGHYCFLPCLSTSCGDSLRGLYIIRFEYDWIEYCYLLAVRK